ncbi:MAG: hypothetical protein ACHQF4_00690 [Sphingobacteriales bacterium]
MKIQRNYVLFAVIIFMVINQGCKKEIQKKSLFSPTPAYFVTILAGTDDAGFQNGAGVNSRFGAPRQITAYGNYLYVADEGNNAIRRVSISDNSVITLAGGSQGFADGSTINAKFNSPIGIAAGPDGNLYVTDFGNFKIRKVTLAGLVTTFAGCDSGYVNGPVKSSPSVPMAEFGRLDAIAIAKDGTIFVYDYSAAKIRKISTGGIVSDYAGSTRGDADGTATTAQFNDIEGIAIADDGTLYVACTSASKIKKITTTGIVTTIAGSTVGYADGPALTAQFANPYGVAIASDGSIYVTDEGNHYIRKISTAGIVSTVAGVDRGISEEPSTSGPGNVALLFYPDDPVILNNILYFTESNEVSSLTLP